MAAASVTAAQAAIKAREVQDLKEEVKYRNIEKLELKQAQKEYIDHIGKLEREIEFLKATRATTETKYSADWWKERADEAVAAREAEEAAVADLRETIKMEKKVCAMKDREIRYIEDSSFVWHHNKEDDWELATGDGPQAFHDRLMVLREGVHVNLISPGGKTTPAIVTLWPPNCQTIQITDKSDEPIFEIPVVDVDEVRYPVPSKPKKDSGPPVDHLKLSISTSIGGAHMISVVDPSQLAPLYLGLSQLTCKPGMHIPTIGEFYWKKTIAKLSAVGWVQGRSPLAVLKSVFHQKMKGEREVEAR